MRIASKTIFVTVGTTKFDALVQAVDDLEFADAAIACGQKGAGKVP